MSEDETRAGRRVECLHCGEQILDRARVCPFCKLTALVDVVALRTLDDRGRYELARVLLSSPASAQRGLAAIQRDLLASPPVLARAVTRHLADSAIKAAQGVGVDAAAQLGRAASFTPAPQPSTSSSSIPVGLILAVCGLAAAVAGGVWVARHSWDELVQQAGLASSPAPTPPPRSDATNTRVDGGDGARAALASVVSIRCGKQGGSGFFIGPDLVLTNDHVLCGDKTPVQVATIDGRRSLGMVVKTDPFLDLGLVRVHMTGDAPKPLLARDAASLDAGRRVFMIGSPLGLDFTFHEGHVSRVGQPLLGLGYIQFDARVNPGNSGGPLIDETGHVVGVVSMKMQGEGLGLALPINYAFDYKGRSLLPSPPEWKPSDAFVKLTQAAQAADLTSESEFRTGISVPVIVSTRSDQYGRPLILVGRASESEPPSEDFTFEFRVNDEILCLRNAHTARWDERLDKLTLPPRLAEWMEEHRLRIKLFTTEVSPGLSGCPAFRGRSVKIVLQGGEGSPSFQGR